ncbi:MAG: gp53-like domain-containing protein [Fusobacteriaceae bacterium]
MTWNSTLPLFNGTLGDVENALGPIQFQAEASFYFIQNGLIFQGGKLNLVPIGFQTLNFPSPFTRQILSIQLTEIDGGGFVRVNSPTTDLDTLGMIISTAPTSLYWYAIGV